MDLKPVRRHLVGRASALRRGSHRWASSIVWLVLLFFGITVVRGVGSAWDSGVEIPDANGGALTLLLDRAEAFASVKLDTQGNVSFAPKRPLAGFGGFEFKLAAEMKSSSIKGAVADSFLIATGYLANAVTDCVVNEMDALGLESDTIPVKAERVDKLPARYLGVLDEVQAVDKAAVAILRVPPSSSGFTISCQLKDSAIQIATVSDRAILFPAIIVYDARHVGSYPNLTLSATHTAYEPTGTVVRYALPAAMDDHGSTASWKLLNTAITFGWAPNGEELSSRHIDGVVAVFSNFSLADKQQRLFFVLAIAWGVVASIAIAFLESVLSNYFRLPFESREATRDSGENTSRVADCRPVAVSGGSAKRPTLRKYWMIAAVVIHILIRWNRRGRGPKV